MEEGDKRNKKTYEWFKDSCEDFIKTFPVQFHLPTHNGRYINQEYYEFQKNVSNPRQIDGSWFGLYDVEGLKLEDGRLCDLGPKYHETFSSQMTLFLQNGSTLGNLITCLALSKKKVLIQCNAHISVFNGLQQAQAEIGLLMPKHDLKYDIYLPIGKEEIMEGLK